MGKYLTSTVSFDSEQLIKDIYKCNEKNKVSILLVANSETQNAMERNRSIFNNSDIQLESPFRYRRSLAYYCCGIKILTDNSLDFGEIKFYAELQ